MCFFFFFFLFSPPGGSFIINVEVDGKKVDSQPARASLADPAVLRFDLAKSKVAQDLANAALNKAIQAGGAITPEMEHGLTPEQKDALEKKLSAEKESIQKRAALNASYSAGMTAMEQKQWTEAINQLEKASQLEPKETAVWVNLADSYLADSASKTGADK